MFFDFIMAKSLDCQIAKLTLQLNQSCYHLSLCTYLLKSGFIFRMSNFIMCVYNKIAIN